MSISAAGKGGTMSQVKCSGCGKLMSAMGRFCSSCGQQIMSPQSASSGMPVWAGCLIAIGVMMFVTAIIGLLAAIAIPSFIKARNTAQDNVCINNLRMISGAKDMHALENSTDPETGLSWEELKPTLEKNGWGMPSCPGDSQHTPETSYEIGQLGIDPTCKINQRHRLTGVGR